MASVFCAMIDEGEGMLLRAVLNANTSGFAKHERHCAQPVLRTLVLKVFISFITKPKPCTIDVLQPCRSLAHLQLL